MTCLAVSFDGFSLPSPNSIWTRNFVYHCAMSTPRMVGVQDPFERLLVRPFLRTRVVETVREVCGVRIGHSLVIEAGEV